MKVLTIGKSGQVAKSLVERAAYNSAVSLVAVGRNVADLEVVGSIAALITGEQPDIVINAAAYTAVDDAEDEPERAYRINADAAGEVAKATAKIGADLIHLSTDYVFDGLSHEPYKESAVTGPLNVYGQSKLAGEQMVRECHSDHVIVRTAWVFSPFGRNFVKTMMTLAQERDRIKVVDDQLGNPTDALNLADALLSVCEKIAQARGQTFHVAGSGTASWFEVARVIMSEREGHGLSSAVVEPIQTGNWPSKAARPHHSSLNCDKFAQRFGIILPDWRQSVRAAVIRLARSQAI